MTTYIIVNSIVIILLIVVLFNLASLIKSIRIQLGTGVGIKSETLDWKILVLLVAVVILILFSLISPFIFTRIAINNDFDFSATGQIGDTVSGLMNPFIAIAGVIVTGLAFYIQYEANLQQRSLFELGQKETRDQLQLQINNQNHQNKVQQSESQFYEMLRLHRENVTEMKINGYDFTEEKGPSLVKFLKLTEGRKVFVTMKTEFECILALYKKDRKLDKEGFRKCYELFFFGLDEWERKYPDEKLFAELLRKARLQHEYPVPKKITSNLARKDFLPYMKLKFNYKPFSGHSSRLGHYFRHLFLTVKSIVNSTTITDYSDKMNYLRLLRAQLSNHEQILLFYNWVADFGERWENEENAFFTEYCMIHNLWYDSLLKDDYIKSKEDELRTKHVKLRTGPMFEID